MSIGIVASAAAGATASGYEAEVLADSPLLYWRLGESSGTTAADNSGNGRDGTYVGSPTLGSTSLLASDADTCVDIATPSSQRVEIGYGSWVNVADLTVELWANFDDVSGALRIITSRWNLISTWLQFNMQIASGVLKWEVHTSTGTKTVTGPSLSNSTTYHLVGVFDSAANESRLYVNKTEYKVSTTGTLSTSTNVNSWVDINGIRGDSSGGWTGAYPMDGRVDEFAFYDSALSSTRISAHYDAA